MKAILNKLNNYLPMREFLNFFFITALGDYLQTEINISSLEKEISQKAVISLLGLKLNTSIINERHLAYSPMKLIEGTINKLEMTLTDEKIGIYISEMTMLVMPVFNKNNLIMYQSNPFKVKINSNTLVSSNDNKTYTESIINSMMQNVEVIIGSICIKILTYEVFGNSLDNPTLSLFISKIHLKNKKESQEKDFFLFDKELSLDHFCIKIDQYYTQDETIFHNACKVQDEKLLFNFYCSNNTICAIDYTQGPGIIMLLKKNDAVKSKKESQINKTSDEIKEQISIDINIKRIEVIVNSFQISQLLIFNTICNKIYSSNIYDINSIKTEESLSNNLNQKIQFQILGHTINGQSINISFELINLLINENITAKETPKLFSFYTKELQKTIKTMDEIENHFCYFEDNFFILVVDTIKYCSDNSAFTSQSSLDLKRIVFDYVEYQSKQPKKTSKIMSKKPSFMKMGSGSKLALSQMQSCCGDSIYQSAQSASNNSVYESVLDSELVLIENFNKLIAYDFYNSSFRLLNIEAIEAKMYGNRFLTLHHSITNCSIVSISIDFHLAFLFKMSKLFYANNYLKEIKESTQLKAINNDDKSPLKKEQSKPMDKGNNSIKFKQQIFISIKLFGIKLLNFKRDMSRIDTNAFFYEFFKENIENYYLKKSSPNKYQMAHNISINSIKSKDYLLFKLSEIKILNTLKQKDSEIKIVFSQIILNYNYYNLLSFANAELPNIIIKGKRIEFVTELVAPLKLSTLDSDGKNNQEIDFNALSNKNEMYFRNEIITIKSQYDYKDHTNTLRISLNLIEEIHVNCEYHLIQQVINYSDTFMFALNIVQIYQSYCEKIKSSLIEKMFTLLAISKIDDKMLVKTESNTNVFITMDINNLIIFLNRNNSLSNEGNLLKIIITKLTSNAAFRYDQTINETEIDIENIQLFIKKNTKTKEDIRQSHTSLIKQMNIINQDVDSDAANYILFLSKTIDSSPDSIKSSSLISLHAYFNNEPNIKQPLLLNEKEITNENSYQVFLLQNQLQMPNIIINSKLIISNCYINLTWYNFDLKSNGLCCFIEELNANSNEDYINNTNDNIAIKELIPLCQERMIDLSVAIGFQTINFDFFFSSSMIPKKDWMRMIIVLTNAQLKQKENNSEMNFEKCRFFYLNNFDYTGVESFVENNNNILSVIGDIANETSYLNRIGFVELCYIQGFNIKKKNNFKNDKPQKTIIVLTINSIEFFFCKDSFILIQEFQKKTNEHFQSIIGYFSKDKLIIDDVENENEDKTTEVKNNNNIIIMNNDNSNLINNKELKKEYHVIENYCFNTNKYDKQLEEIKEIEAEDDYENIINAQKKKRLNQRKKSFDVLIGNEIENEEQNEEGDVQIKGLIIAFRIYLFKGRDYAFLTPSFSDKNNLNNNITNSIEQSVTLISNNQQLVIEDNYLQSEGLNKNSLIFLYQTRQRIKQRDYFNHLSFYLCRLKGDINYNNKTEIMLYSSFTITKFTIEDKIKQSKYSKILSKYNYEDHLDFCWIKIEVYRSITDQSNGNVDQNEELQLGIEAQLAPINILIDQISLLFLLQFLQVKFDLLNNNLLNNSSCLDIVNTQNIVNSDDPIQINDSYLCDLGEFEQVDKESNHKVVQETKPEDNSVNSITIKKISIKEFKLNLSYNSHELSIQQLKKKNYLELLNISNITDFQVQFKNYERNKCKPLHESITDLITFWRNDITKNQIVFAVLHSVAIVRPFVAIFDSMFDLIKQPVLSFRKNYNIQKGLGKGIKNFFSTFTTQSLFIGEKSFKTIQKMLGATQSNTLNKNSYYKKWMYKVNEGKRKYDEHFLKK